MRLGKVLILLVAVGLTCQSCKFNCIRGSGNVITQSRQIASFSELEVSGAYNIELTQDSVESLEIKGDDNLLEQVKTVTSGTKLKISSKRSFCTTVPISIWVHAKKISAIDIYGANNVITTNKFHLDNFKFSSSGITESIMEMEARRITTTISGAGKLMLKGQTGVLDIKISGAGKIAAFDMIAGKCNVTSSGAGEAELNVLNQLEVSASGASKVLYKGKPSQIIQKASGASSIKSAD
ncbi:head GIN domain-containing protein [Solitalea koreensis]|uniref:Auto-transporter adhesin, head GIN domain n=1 Tax=Solitalea koreensis TaxID=543615 RepID=A0A521BH00_9SPHI|nr:head GIN domain-containing protein [Solitalea koreensis]SMO46319.1 Putative auto-transporter adhesin, head GIN domain [Solitalea koreensis]